MKLDLTADIPINHVACAYRDFRAGILTQDGAALILTSNLRLPQQSALTILAADPGSEDIARALCMRDGWEHHEQTDDFPCASCEADAEILTKAARPSPPVFPTVTIHTPDGDVTMPCEPVGDHLAIVASIGMTDGDEPGTFKAVFPGTFDVVIRATGLALAAGGCITCARGHAEVLAVLPTVDWSADQDQIREQIAKLPEDSRRELASGVDLSWGCDAEWCDRTGPGVVTIPVP